MLGLALRRLRVGWLMLVAVGVGLWRPAPDATTALLDQTGRVAASGLHRAEVFGFWGLGLTLALVVLAALWARQLVGRDRAWIAPRPASRRRVGGAACLGLATAVFAVGLALSVATEARLPVEPGERWLQSGTDAGLQASVVRISADQPWRVELTNLPPKAKGHALTLHVRAAPMLGNGRSGSITSRALGLPFKATLSADRADSQANATTQQVGTTRWLRLPLGVVSSASIALTVEHTGEGAAVALYAGDAWISAHASSSRSASAHLASLWFALTLILAGLAFGLATRLAPTIAVLLTLSLAVASSALGDPLHLGLWWPALHLAQAGAIPPATPWTALISLASVGILAIGLFAAQPRDGAAGS